ncbi:hypothetical protein FHETE_6386 [Fusarium heterosporum]|uniref:F-box domain-containing protein n=1 Tax=Fusarium heterosporum TaxID=42747 RepID=A0A8H5T5N8_FUSHE|nr:hypothetical protein FHETE_6386 [Fusarium heterosporum]
MRCQPRASKSKLTQLPAEILAEIIELLSNDKSSLASLALVNSDCRQLARCRQFAEVDFDYSLPAQNLVLHLAQEAVIPSQQFNIASCIRLAAFASRPQHLAQHHQQLYESVQRGGEQLFTEEQRRKLSEEGDAHYRNFQTACLGAISAMSNLESLIWRDRFSLDARFFEILTRTSAQHVELVGITLYEPWSLKPPLTPSTWPIKSLNLDVELHLEKYEELSHSVNGTIHPMTTFFSTLFRLCSETLESLTWSYKDVTSSVSRIPVSIADTVVSFPRLRCLLLPYLKLDGIAVSSFLAAPLKSLHLSKEILSDPEVLSCEPIRNLETFIVPALPGKAQACQSIGRFISQHKQIQKLYFREGSRAYGNAAHLDNCIIPALDSPDFGNLSSLSLAWGGGYLDQPSDHGVEVPVTAMRVIGKILSLQQLRLGAGMRRGWRHQWLVDHDELRRHFGQLKGLKRLALTRDTYQINLSVMHPQRYYALRWVGVEEETDANKRLHLDANKEVRLGDMDESEILFQMWERAHRNRMLDQAEKWATTLPNLQWMFCGQRPMGFIKIKGKMTEPPEAVTLTQERDECRTYLESIFRGFDGGGQ